MSRITKSSAESVEDREPTKTDRVYLELRRRIRDLELPPGAQLNKNELAEEFDVSRAPISEALARLANEGLVEIYRQSGSFVAPIRNQDLRESMIIRTALEIEAVRRATTILTDDDLEVLRENLRGQEEALETHDLARLDALDAAFHAQIASIIECPRLASELESCRARLDRQRFSSLGSNERPDDTLREHQRIFDAIASRDPEYAASAMRAHLGYVYTAIERWFEEEAAG